MKKASLEEKLAKAQETIARLEDLIGKFDSKAKLMDQQLKKQMEEIRIGAMLAEGLKRSARENSQHIGEFKFHVERLEKEAHDLKQVAEEKAVQIEKLRQVNTKLNEEMGLMKRKLDLIGSGDSELLIEEQRKQLEHKLTCSVCNDRQKNTIITRCWHAFCRECIQKNLEVRSRKCPRCGKQFAESDVHNFYL